MKRWAGIAAAVMLGMSLSLTGCGKAVNKGPSAPLVKTIVIGEDAKDAKDTFSGTVHGFFESPLAFQTGGRIMQRYVTSGERVTPDRNSSVSIRRMQKSRRQQPDRRLMRQGLP